MTHTNFPVKTVLRQARWFPDVLLLLVPVAFVLEGVHASPTIVFITSALAMIPLAGWMGKATEQVAEHVGEGAGGLLNATFGNAAELIIAVSAIRQGLFSVVKASLTGSIIGNILLVLGGAMLAGGSRREKQKFNATAASAGASSLTLAAIALIAPAALQMFAAGDKPADVQTMSMLIAGVLLVTYACSLLFSLRTHKHLYMGGGGDSADSDVDPWGWKMGLLVLAVATVAVGAMSDILVRAVEPAAAALGLHDAFIGIVVISIIGNAAEHTTAIQAALKDRMDLALGITLGSSTQIALFVAPALVVISRLIGKPMDLVFTNAEVLAIALSVYIVGQVSQDGESNWWEGVQLLSVYAILALVFYFVS